MTTNEDYMALSDSWNLPFVAVHGTIMLFIWNVWMPLGALYMRHWGRTQPNGVWIHACSQLLGCIVCLLSGAMIVFNGHAPLSVLQQVFGWPVFILTMVQIVTGFRQLLGLVVCIIALLNSPQGIHIMAPIHEKPVHPMWLFFWITTIAFLVATCVLEYMRYQRLVVARQHKIETLQQDKASDAGSSMLLVHNTAVYRNLSTLTRNVGDKAMDPLAVVQTAAADDSLNAGTPSNASQVQKNPNHNQIPGLPSMSWVELDTAIRSSGEYWVIGPGNAIIDIRQWITTHPGGQTILLDSIGTSVVRDVFPMPSPPPMCAGICAEEWLHVSASRRESEHSTQALDKMRSMIIGYVKPSPGVLPGQFDPLEYRRYAVVRKESSSGPGATRTTYLVGLAELYPSGPGAPAFFLPGHVIEIRMRVSKSTMVRLATSNPQVRERIPSSGWISRYYTPICGSMSRFDITIKLVADGAMSYLIQRLSPSEYPQVQVRGPFGTPLINPERPLPVSNGCWDHVVMLCAGSGSVAALQFASWMFLNAHFPGSLHRPVGDLQPGTPVIVVRPSAEPGQVTIAALNLDASSHNRKPLQAPMTSITPWVGNSPRLTVLCAESDYASVTGRNMFDSISSAYPSQFQVHYRTDSLPPTNRIPYITQGTMTAEYIQMTLMTRCDPNSTHFIVCGPKRFVDECYGVLEEMAEARNVTCLPPHTYLSRAMPPFLKDGVDSRLAVRKDAKGMQLWFARSGEKEKEKAAAVGGEAVKQPPAIG